MNSLRAGILPVNHRLLCALACAVVACSFVASSQAAPSPRKPGQRVSRGKAVQSDTVAPTTPERGNESDLQLSKEDENKADAMGAFLNGFIAEDAADTDKAFAEYKKAFSLDPGNSTLAIKLAFELARRGDAVEAANILKDAIKASPKDPAPYLYLSELYAKALKKPDLALKYAVQAIDADPGNGGPYLAVCELYLTNGDTKKAGEILERALKVTNGNAQFWLQLANFCTRIYIADQGPGAPEGLKKLSGILAKAAAVANGDPLVQSKIADYYVLAREVKQAIPLYREVMKTEGGDERFLNEVRVKLVHSYLANNQRPEAIALLEKSADRAEAHELLGEIYEEDGDLEKALENYRKSLDLASGQATDSRRLAGVYVHVASVLLKNKKNDEALALLQQAREKLPNLAPLTYSLARAMSASKKHDEALAMFEVALQEAKQAQEDEKVIAEFYFSYGAAAEQAGQIEKAVTLLKKAIELDPEHADQACNYLGYMWVDRGENLAQASELIQRALKIDPANGAYLDSLGWYYLKKGEPAKALPELLKAAENMKPEDATVFDHLGDTYLALGDGAQALVNWQKAATLDSENKKIADKVEKAKQKMTSNPPAREESGKQ